MQRIRVLVVDDHRIFAESLASALAAEQDVEVAAAGSAPAALRCLARGASEGRPFDVLLVDADLADERSASATNSAANSAAGVPGGPAGRPAGTGRVGGAVDLGRSVRAMNGEGHGGDGPGGDARAGGAAVRQTAAGYGRAVAARTAAGRGGVERVAVERTVGEASVSGPSVAGRGGAAPAGVSRAEPGAAVGNGEGPAGEGGAAPVGGIALVARVRERHPELHTVVLAERDDPVHAASALQAGAAGWVAKDCSLSRLLQVLRGVLRGETHLPPALLTGVLKELTATRKHRSESQRLVESLTPREHEVLCCMVAGLGRKAVAERLYLSPHTVRTHMQNVLGKLGVHSTLAAVALARRAGVGPAGPAPEPARPA